MLGLCRLILRGDVSIDRGPFDMICEMIRAEVLSEHEAILPLTTRLSSAVCDSKLTANIRLELEVSMVVYVMFFLLTISRIVSGTLNAYEILKFREVSLRRLSFMSAGYRGGAALTWRGESPDCG